jgi:hypothetical protein
MAKLRLLKPVGYSDINMLQDDDWAWARSWATSASSSRRKRPLGSKPSQEWEAIGYPSGTIAMPDSVEGRLAVLIGMRDYLTANPGKQVTTEDIVFTFAEAEILRKALSDARAALNDAVGARVQVKGVRDAAVDDLRTAMSGLVGELAHIPLGDDSPNGITSGSFRRPAPMRPACPTALVFIKWALIPPRPAGRLLHALRTIGLSRRLMESMPIL